MDDLETSFQIATFPDQFSLGLVSVITLAVLVVSIEIGFRLGSRQEGKQVKGQASQVRAIMGATLSLLAFMLAFTFAAAQTHYETRVANMVEEARQVNNAFLHAEFLNDPFRTQARILLREYIGDRILLAGITDPDQWGEVLSLVKKSEGMQRELWELGLANERESRPKEDSIGHSPFTVSVVGMIDIHVLRLQAVLANRISRVIWATLYLAALLGMLVMGYQAGLTSRRSPFATVTLAVAFSAVMILITDLDRPMQSMFVTGDQVLANLAEKMDESLLNERAL